MLLDFQEFPKQWLIAQSVPVAFQSSRRTLFNGWHVMQADSVPLVTLEDNQHSILGVVIGWIIRAVDADQLRGTRCPRRP